MLEAPGLLTGRTAVVTGGANGIGAAIVRWFRGAGATGAIFDLPQNEPADTPEGWTSIDVDVRDEANVAAAFGTVGTIDIVVAAAGIVPRWQGVAALDLQEWDDVFAVNARGVAATLKHGAPAIPDGGAIVAVASLNAWRGDGNLTSYTASKHAVLGIVRSAALDLGPRGIRVNAVGPGPIATDALRGRLERREAEGGATVTAALEAAASATALRRIATADNVASAVTFLASDLAGGMTGQLLAVDGGLL